MVRRLLRNYGSGIYRLIYVLIADVSNNQYIIRNSKYRPEPQKHILQKLITIETTHLERHQFFRGTYPRRR